MADPTPGGFDLNQLAGLIPPPMSSQDANILSLVQALQEEDKKQRPSASPLGAIANALIPVLTAPVRARQLESQSRAQQLPIMLQLMSLASQSAKAPLENRELAARADKTEMEAKELKDSTARRAQMMKSPLFAQLFGGAAGTDAAPGADPAAGAGTSGAAPAGMKPRITMNAKGEPSITFSSDVMSPEAMTQHEKLNSILGGQRLDTSKQLEDYKRSHAPLKPLPLQWSDNYARMTEGVKTLDDVISTVEGGGLTQADALKATLSGGLLSTPTLRKYATFYNDVAQGRYKSRVTAAEMKRLSQELPPPSSYVADPDGFMKSLRIAREHSVGILGKDLEYQSKSFDIPTELRDDIMGLTKSGIADTKAPGEAPGGVAIGAMKMNKSTGLMVGKGSDGKWYELDQDQWIPYGVER